MLKRIGTEYIHGRYYYCGIFFYCWNWNNMRTAAVVVFANAVFSI
jgi:hypothetical protein